VYIDLSMIKWYNIQRKNMSSNRKTGCTLNLGFLSTIGIIFIVLKFLSIEPVAHWSWIWVLSPFWIGIGVGISVILLWLLILFIIVLLGVK